MIKICDKRKAEAMVVANFVRVNKYPVSALPRDIKECLLGIDTNFRGDAESTEAHKIYTFCLRLERVVDGAIDKVTAAPYPELKEYLISQAPDINTKAWYLRTFTKEGAKKFPLGLIDDPETYSSERVKGSALNGTKLASRFLASKDSIESLVINDFDSGLDSEIIPNLVEFITTYLEAKKEV